MVGRDGDDIFLGQRLDSVGNGLKEAGWACAIRAVAKKPLLGNDEYLVDQLRHLDSPPTGCGWAPRVAFAWAASAAAFAFASALARSSASAESTAAASVG